MTITTRTIRRSVAALAVLTAVLWLGRAGAAEDASLRQKALRLNDVTGDEGVRASILALFNAKDEGKKLVSAALPLLKEKDQPLKINALFILGRSAQGLNQLDAAEAYYRAYIDAAEKLRSGHKVANGWNRLIQTLLAAKKYAAAEKEARTFIEMEDFDDDDVFQEDPEKRRKNNAISRAHNAVFEQMIIAMVRQGPEKADEALNTLNRIIRNQQANWLLQELKGRVLREVGKMDESAKTYEKVLDTILKDDTFTKGEREELAASVRYALSGVYVDLKKVDKAAAQLKKLLELEPDNPTFNNDLGFIWADHDMNLDESEKLIRKALEDDRKQRLKDNPDLKPADYKDNPSYVDSLGWVLFKKKQYAEAKKYLEQAVKDPDEGQNLEIYDHLGDVCLALGEKSEAVNVWKKGLEHAGTSKREKERKIEVEKKIKANE
jgi:tetratricopeptide (TPR) repeat protein